MLPVATLVPFGLTNQQPRFFDIEDFVDSAGDRSMTFVEFVVKSTCFFKIRTLQTPKSVKTIVYLDFKNPNAIYEMFWSKFSF